MVRRRACASVPGGSVFYALTLDIVYSSMAHQQTVRHRHRHVTRLACDPRYYWLLPHKPLPNREALVLWIRLRPFRRVADIWLLRPEDNQPNPCGIQGYNSFPKARAIILRQAELL